MTNGRTALCAKDSEVDIDRRFHLDRDWLAANVPAIVEYVAGDDMGAGGVAMSDFR